MRIEIAASSITEKEEQNKI